MGAKAIQFSVLLACAVASGGCTEIMSHVGNQVQGSGRPAAENRTVESFHKISEDGAANVLVTIGPSTSVKVEGDDNIVPLVRTKVKDDELLIETKKNFRTDKKLLVTVTVPSLTSIELNGAASIKVHNVSGSAFSVGLNGAGSISLDGSVGSVDASVNGTGNLKLSDLKAKSASTSVNGVGNIEVWATDSLAANVDGVGNIRYKGSPSITKTVNGVGKVSQLE